MKESKRGSLTLFVENCSTSKVSMVNDVRTVPSKIRESIARNNHLTESVTKHGIWKFPIGRVNTADKPNANGRVYNRQLWENVMNNQRNIWYQSTALADHPLDESAGSFKDVTLVWLGMEISDISDLVYGYGAFVGPNGALAKDILDKGGKIGFSSSGFGELLSDGKTVNPDTYEIERLADVVLNPSQGVFGTIDDLDHEFCNDVTDSQTVEYTKQQPLYNESTQTQPKSKLINMENNKMSASYNAVNIKAEDKPAIKENVMSKVEEKAWRKYVESFVNDATNIDNPTKRLEEMVEILNLFEEGYAPDLKEKLMEKIVEERQSLMSMVESAVNIQNELGDLDKVTERAKSVINEGMELKASYEELLELNEGLKKRNRELARKNTALQAKLSVKEKKIDRFTKEFGEKIVESEDKSDSLKEQLSEARQRISELKSKNKKLENSNESLEKSLSSYKKRLSSIKEATHTVSSDNAKYEERIKRLSEKNRQLRNQILDLTEKETTYKNMLERMKTNNDRLSKFIEDSKNAEKAKKKAEIDELMESSKSYAERTMGCFNFRENQGIDIEEYWQSQLTRYGENILPYEKQIRGAKTLREAQSAFMKNMDKIVSSMGVAFDSFEVGMNDSINRSKLKENGFVMKEDYTESEVNENFRKLRESFGLL